MTQQASGSFDVKMTPQSLADPNADSALGRMSIDKKYQGDLSGTGRGEMLMAGTAVTGSAGYVAIERVDGILHGRSGSFVLQHCGTMDRGAPQLSGTGALTGISGSLVIIRDGGQHRYELDYVLPEQD